MATFESLLSQGFEGNAEASLIGDIAQVGALKWVYEPAGWLLALPAQRDLYHAGESNRIRALCQGTDRWLRA